MDVKLANELIAELRVARVALDFMNTVHDEELQLVKVLIEALVKGDNNAIESYFSQWVEHTQTHFSREERLMKEHGFPPYPVHKGEHDKELSRLNKCYQAWQSQAVPAVVLEYISKQWWPWLHRHIATMDTVTAMYLSQMNLDIEL